MTENHRRANPMKSLNKLRVAATSSRSLRFFQRCAVTSLAATLLAAGSVYGQGQYFPVNPPGAPYGATYTGITVHSNPDLIYLQDTLQNTYGMNVTLQVPIPTGSVAPTPTQYAAAATTCINGILNGSAPAGVTLATLSNEAVAYSTVNQATTTKAIALAIVQFNGGAAAPANLNTVVNALAVSQPSLIDSIMPNILSQAGTTVAAAAAIPQLVATAITDIPTDLTRISSIVGAGASSIVAANLSATQKTTLFINSPTSYVNAVLNAQSANGNPAVIEVILKNLAYGNYSSLVPPSGGLTSLDQVLNAAVAALPSQTNDTLAAVTDGALAVQGGSAAAIKTRMASAAPSFSSYTGAVVDGYTNGTTLAAFQAYVTGNPGYADAAASGAVTRGSLSGASLLQYALTYGSADPTNTVAEAIYANVSVAASTALGAINLTTRVPYGSATFGNIAYGVGEATPLASIGSVVQTVVTYSGPSSATLTSSIVNSIVDQAIQGASHSGNSGAFASIVYNAEYVARNTSGASAPLVTQAIDSIQAVGGLPYIAAIATAAADTGVNRTAIQSAAVTALNAPAGGGGVYTSAASAGMTLVQSVQTTPSTYFTTILSSYKAAAAASSDTVIADLYAAILTNPSEADAGLAAAIKQSAVSDTLLTTNAINALSVTNSSLTPNLQMVDAVVTHIQAEAAIGGATGVSDLFDFVSHQIVIAPSLYRDIAIAATVIDPDHAHFTAHAVAFTAPMTASGAVAPIFEYAQITNPHPLALPTPGNASGALTTKAFPGSPVGAIIDQPAAAAAITAGLTTGILEANLSTANTQTALSSTVAAAVAASLAQNGTLLRGPTSPFFSNGVATAGSFQQSDGGVGTSTNAQTVGAAGAITGYIAEVTLPTDTTISAVTKAVLAAAVGGGARPYALAMAQAAGQALAWVANANFNSGNVNNATYTAQAAADIANAMAASVSGFATLAQLTNAATFGINQAEAGVIGAGALGLNATNLNAGNNTLTVKATGNNNSDFYLHRSAAGTPVTDIFNL